MKPEVKSVIEDYSKLQYRLALAVYVCRNCGNELFLYDGDDPEMKCPRNFCGGIIEKSHSLSAFVKKRDIKN